MKVYVVMEEWPYDGAEVDSVWKSKEKAETRANKIHERAQGSFGSVTVVKVQK